MADAADQKKKAPKAAPKSGGNKPDLSTLAGIALAFGGIIGGLLLEKGSIQDVAQMTAAMIVAGGTFGAVLVTSPLPIVLRAYKGPGSVFFEQVSSIPGTIEAIIHAIAGRQALDGLALEIAGDAQVFLRDEGVYVGLDRERHREILSVCSAGILPVTLPHRPVAEES